ncbi:MAG: RNA-binding S4 domain-containing protein [Bacteroidales bacterium]|nr:RNA-binding S4 domain-containing protein [Bacteroidales bacterium]
METRIDKYLWAIRVFKTRSEAADACKSGKVKVNEVEAKPSRDVKENDMITVRKGSIYFTYRVIVPIDKRVGAALVPQYAEDLTPDEEREKLNAPFETIFMRRDRGTGRPTKKERRTLDRLLDDLTVE